MGKMIVVQGDITRQEVDAIVNAANQQLKKGGGVDGAIHRAAGPELQAECDTIGGCPTGEARITKGYRLPARYVIHAVGPRYRGGKKGEAEQLAGCYRHALRLAVENGARTVAFPGISTGIYGYPLEEATEIAVRTVAEQLAGPAHEIEEVRFVTFSDEAREVTTRLLGEVEAAAAGEAG